MVAIAERVPAHVTGDGRHTVRCAGGATRTRTRVAGIGHEKVLTRIKVDEAAVELVKKQGYALEDVPPKGERVLLAATGNMSTGGISIDRTWDAHEDNVEIAEEAARVVGLDVAGIDFLAPDITQPVRETGGAIVEVNAAPGFRMHTHPTEGEPQYVAKHVVDGLFPPGHAQPHPDHRGHRFEREDHHHADDRAHPARQGPRRRDDHHRRRLHRRASGEARGRERSRSPRRWSCRTRGSDMAVFEVARGGILREGLGYGRNDVGVVLNVTGDHLGLREIDTLEQLAAVKRVVVEAVPRNGWAVLNADDPLVLEMRRHCSGNVILFTMADKHDLVERWVRRGRKAVVLERSDRGEMMVIKEGRRTMPIAWVHTLPATFDGKARMMVQNAMAAAAAAHAAGAHLHDIRQGLRSFTTSIYQAPGRLNVFDLDGVKVIIDYAHNAAGLETLGDFVERLAADATTSERPGEASWTANLRVAVVATAGDRRDEDMRELGQGRGAVLRRGDRARGQEPPRTPSRRDGGADPRGRRGRHRRGRARRQRRDRGGRDGGSPPRPGPFAPRRPRRALRRLRHRGLQGAREATRRRVARRPARIRRRPPRRGRRRPRPDGLTRAHGVGSGGVAQTRSWKSATPSRRSCASSRLSSRDPAATIGFGKRVGEGTSEAIGRIERVGQADALTEKLADVDRALDEVRRGHLRHLRPLRRHDPR